MFSMKECDIIKSLADGDEQAFILLFHKYYPVIRKMRRTFRIEGMDKDDFDQEAGLVLIKSAKHFQQGHRASFGTFFKHNLKNRTTDLIRKMNAKKRAPKVPLVRLDRELESLSTKLVDYSAVNPEDSALLKDHLERLYQVATPIEKEALRFIFKLDSEIHLDHGAFINARSRCRYKYLLMDKLTGLI
ncbi:sigma factor [Lentilactobacillus raoultii]|uniref:Sigma factor n=1 Tax=Lentilactobacillus raoultii TaxID=1987503 RepID=A0ABW3PIJ5_9LACO|nr:sigma factor [Lentilactobacillus raoultii]